MTEALLKENIRKIFTLIIGLIGFSFIEFMAKGGNTNTFVGYHSTLIGLLIAAYLGHCFQQRSKFVEDLRKWWFEMAAAKSAILIYLDRNEKKEDDHLLAYYKISTAMDTLRLIYCNVDRSIKNPKGYYPFEQVRDIVDLTLFASPENIKSLKNAKNIKNSIEEIFASLRHSIQDEAHSIIPENPFTYENKIRRDYIFDLQKKFKIDIESIREINKNGKFNSSCEANIPRL